MSQEMTWDFGNMNVEIILRERYSSILCSRVVFNQHRLEPADLLSKYKFIQNTQL